MLRTVSEYFIVSTTLECKPCWTATGSANSWGRLEMTHHVSEGWMRCVGDGKQMDQVNDKICSKFYTQHEKHAFVAPVFGWNTSIYTQNCAPSFKRPGATRGAATTKPSALTVCKAAPALLRDLNCQVSAHKTLIV